MFFSISIACYNAEKYLNRCIESIITQTETDYELIIVDDGSTDNSLHICNEWQRKFPDIIKVISTKNQGSLLARRECIRNSNGEYLYIIDADDYLLNSTFLSSAKKKIMSSGCDMLFFNATSTNKNEPLYSYPFADNQVIEDEKLKDLYYYIITTKSFNPLWTKIFKKNMVDFKCDYNKYSKVCNGTDAFQMIPIVFNCKKILYWNSVEYYYQVENNASSIIHKFNPSYYDSVKAVFNRLYYTMRSSCFYDKEMEHELRVKWLKSISSAVYKVRLCKDNKISYLYLNRIANDTIFQEYYTDSANNISSLQFSHRVLLFLLYHRKLSLIIILIRIISVIKKIK